MEPIFKVGEKVRVKRRIGYEHAYRYSFTNNMAKLVGNVFTISRVFPDHCQTKCVVPDDNALYYTAFIWIEDDITPDQLMINLCGETIQEVYSNAGATITSPGNWPYSTLEDLEKVLDYINEKCHYNTQKPINNPIKQQQQNGNEIKLQRTKGIIRSGKVPKGCGICSKIHKATISSRPLENSAISG